MSFKKPASGSITPILLIVAGVILIVGSAAWFIFLSGPPKVQPTPTIVADIPYPEVPRVNVKDAKAAFDIGNAIFIDVRGDPLYSEGHIPGALSMTADEILDRLDELDPNAWIIPYCT
jgi:hypothetical protein